jgi:hypothetical protein
MAAVGDDDVMASVTALSCKAALLSHNGHFVRSAEKYAAAVAAAQSLQQPDCLIVAFLQLEEVCKLSTHANACNTRADAAKAYERVYRVLLPGMMTALQWRKAAGTLLPGACRAREATFYGDVQRHKAVMRDEPPFEPAVLAELGSLIGYATYVCVADIAVSWLLLRQCYDDPHTMPLPALANDQLAAQHAFVLSALELVQQPRVLSTGCFGGEANLVDKCQKLVSNAAIMDAMPAGWAQQLRDALLCVERSGAMQQRGMEESLADFRQKNEAAHAAGAASAAARGLRCCALSSCGAREAHVSHYKLCAACGGAAYCCKAHQAEDWPAHKHACKAASKAAAAAAAANATQAGGASGA